jgi:homoserine dehydrogenase
VPASPTPVRIGLLGCGNVGAAFVALVKARRADIARRTGLDLSVTRIAVRSISSDRGGGVDTAIFTTDAASVVTDPDVDLVVELIGGVEPARELILGALATGKPVVTANKALLARYGADLFSAADEAGLDLLFEAAVAGGIPLIRPLRESLVGEPIHRVMGIVNGTTNYILTQMTEGGTSYADALAEAQALGYAEADPTADVEGYDAGAKAAIIATIAFGVRVTEDDVYHEGISQITAGDIAVATRMGYRIKLLAVCEAFGDDIDAPSEVGVRVHPVFVPMTHPLASVRDSFNAVFIEGGSVGELMLYGRGAGGGPTASAVLGDVIDAAGNWVRGTHAPLGTFEKARIRSVDEVSSAYYLSLEVADRPGVLAQVATVFGAHGVSIRSMEQAGLEDEARLLFITHIACERDMQATLRELRELDVVQRVGSVLRVVGE